MGYQGGGMNHTGFERQNFDRSGFEERGFDGKAFESNDTKISTAQVLTPNLTQNLIMMTILKINPDFFIILTYPTQNEVFWHKNLYTS